MERVDTGGAGALSTVPPGPSGEAGLDRRRMNLVFVTVLLGMLLAALDQTIVSTALPTIVGDLGGAGHLTLGRLLVPAGGHDRDGAGRQGRRPVRPQAGLPGLGGHVRAGLGLLRVRAEHELADLLARRAGLRRRRSDGHGDGADRRRDPVARARQVPGRAGRGVRGHHRARPAAWAGCSPTTCRGGGRSTSTCRSASAVIALAAVTMPAVKAVARPVLDYLGIVFISLGAAGLTLALSWGGTQYAWSVADDHRAVRGLGGVRWCCSSCSSAGRSTRCCRCACSASSVFSVCVVLAFIVGFALLGRDDVPADLPAVREGASRRPVPACRPCRWCSACWSPRSRPGRSSGRTGPLQDVPRRRVADHGAGPVPALPHGRGHRRTGSMALGMLVLGIGIGLSHAGADDHRAEHGELLRSGRGDVRRHVLPHPGQLVRRRRLRHGVRQRPGLHPPGRRPRSRGGPGARSRRRQSCTPTRRRRSRRSSTRTRTPSTSSSWRRCRSPWLAFVVSLFLKEVPLRGTSRAAASDVGEGFGTARGRRQPAAAADGHRAHRSHPRAGGGRGDSRRPPAPRWTSPTAGASARCTSGNASAPTRACRRSAGGSASRLRC